MTLPEPAGARCWSFLLPNSGRHEVRVANIGTDRQQVELDGRLVPAGARSIFSGPADSLCELKASGQDWVLCVNGFVVEDYEQHRPNKYADESLRQLKSRPDGSYLIQPDIDAASMWFNVVRKFHFWAFGEAHEVELAHNDWIWEVIVGGKLAERRGHTKKESIVDIVFQAARVGDQQATGVVHAHWDAVSNLWQYALRVDDIEVPAWWTKASGEVSPPPAVVVVCDAVQAAALAAAPCEENHENGLRNLESLPQGVSYDASAASFQANIRTSAGRFVCLGNFGSPEEAHQKYLEAIPTYCASRTIAPEILT